jgi:hypothetical protein
MFVQIRGVQRENFQGVWRAGRFWPSGEALRVEVVKDEPEMVDEDIFNDGKKIGTRKVHDKTKISRATLEELKKDGRVSVLADGETDATISKSVLAAAQTAAAEAGAKVVALEAENAELKEANEALAARVAELEGGGKADKDAKHDAKAKADKDAKHK